MYSSKSLAIQLLWFKFLFILIPHLEIKIFPSKVKSGTPIHADSKLVVPPEYGKVFIAVKPSGGYSLTDNQKQILVNDVISPISVLTVVPEIVTPDYVYLLFNASVLVDFKKTVLTSAQIQTLITNGITAFCNANLNKIGRAHV